MTTYWLSPRRFALEHGLPLPTAYQYIRQGLIAHRREGRRVWIDQEESSFFQPPRGVVPMKYRRPDGYLLPGAKVPRAELLWGSVGRSVVDQINRQRHGDTYDGNYRY